MTLAAMSPDVTTQISILMRIVGWITRYVAKTLEALEQFQSLNAASSPSPLSADFELFVDTDFDFLAERGSSKHSDPKP